MLNSYLVQKLDDPYFLVVIWEEHRHRHRYWCLVDSQDHRPKDSPPWIHTSFYIPQTSLGEQRQTLFCNFIPVLIVIRLYLCFDFYQQVLFLKFEFNIKCNSFYFIHWNNWTRHQHNNSLFCKCFPEFGISKVIFTEHPHNLHFSVIFSHLCGNRLSVYD